MGALDAALRLNASLDEVAAALAAPDADALLAAEAGLAAALTAFTSLPSAGPDDRHPIAAEVVRARATLVRCRVLGAAIADMTRITLAAQGHSTDYGPSGEPVHDRTGDIRGHRLRARL